jgi:hypothetical protein
MLRFKLKKIEPQSNCVKSQGQKRSIMGKAGDFQDLHRGEDN